MFLYIFKGEFCQWLVHYLYKTQNESTSPTHQHGHVNIYVKFHLLRLTEEKKKIASAGQKFAFNIKKEKEKKPQIK